MKGEYSTMVKLRSFSDKTMENVLLWYRIKTIDNVCIDHMGWFVWSSSM